MMSAFTMMSSKTFDEKKREIFLCKSDPCIRLNASFEVNKFCSVEDMEEEREINLSFITDKYEKIMSNFNTKYSLNVLNKEVSKTTKSYKSM